jgi:hypothetical protein
MTFVTDMVIVFLLCISDALHCFVHAVDGGSLDALHRAALIKNDEVVNTCLHVIMVYIVNNLSSSASEGHRRVLC